MLNIGNNAKTIKSDTKYNVLTGILYLAPAKTSGYNVCPEHTVGCATSCLFSAGFGRQTHIKEARIAKTLDFFNNRKEFIAKLDKQIKNLSNRCKKNNLLPVVRLNGTSDIYWEDIAPQLFIDNPDVTFYSYTKVRKRYEAFLSGKLPSNSQYVFSRSEKNEADCLRYLRSGGSVAVVGNIRPKTWHGFKTVDGDAHDLIFLHKNKVLWLTPKGLAKKDKTGFVIWN